ncbi:MAG: hypothetical protein MUO40_04645 [Anaerolineaceae bacterium]|nr:hypothetical protein [Anaerolineaceae bacterium]
MKNKLNITGKLIIALSLTIFIIGCGISPTISPTPTPTESGSPISSSNNLCNGLSGELEMQILVGPAEVVGLEPIVVGNIPFITSPDGGTFVFSGGESISYEDILEKAWGTYTVEFDLEAVITGTCEMSGEDGVLNMTVQTSGSQLVEVRAEGFQGDYPWSGTHTFDLALPIAKGAIAQGEGWAFVLHINN